MGVLRRLFPPAPPAIEIELTARLVGGSEAIALVGALAAVTSLQAALNRDPLTSSLLLAVALVSLARVVWLRRLGRRHGTHPPDLPTARRWQYGFAAGSLASSLLLGLTSLLALSYRDSTLALLVVCALCCYVFSLVLRTAVRPAVCLTGIAAALIPTFAGLPLFMHEGNRLDPGFALAALGTVALVIVLSCIQLTAHLYRTTLNELLARRDLIRFARRDPLTGLSNRLALRESFEMLFPAPSRPAALLYLDLDGFKPVNDQHGHQLGDSLLGQVATRLSACVRPGDEVFRIGGDEFAVLLPRVRQPSDATELARRLLAALAEPYQLMDRASVRISASIGIAFVTEPHADLDELAASADAALYDAKRSGRATFRVARPAPELRLIA